MSDISQNLKDQHLFDTDLKKENFLGLEDSLKSGVLEKDFGLQDLKSDGPSSLKTLAVIDVQKQSVSLDGISHLIGISHKEKPVDVVSDFDVYSKDILKNVESLGGIASLFVYCRPEDASFLDEERKIRHIRELFLGNKDYSLSKKKSLFLKTFDSANLYRRSSDFLENLFIFIRTVSSLCLENKYIILGGLSLTFLDYFLSKAVSVVFLFAFAVYYYFRMRAKIKSGVVKAPYLLKK